MDDTDDRHGLDRVKDVVRRRWPVIVAAAMLVPLVSVLLAALQQPEPLYQAQARVFIGRATIAATLTGSTAALALADATRLAQTQAELAGLERVIRRTLRAVGIRPTRKAIRRFQRDGNVYPQSTSDLLSFVVKNKSRQRAMRLATEWAVQSTRYRRELDQASIRGAREDIEQRLARLQPRGDQDSDLYRSLLDKQQQLAVMEKLQESNGLLAEPARTAVRADKPQSLVRKGILGLIVGLSLGAAIALIWEVFDTRIRSADALRRLLDLPLLARLPATGRLMRGRTPVMLSESTGAEAEALWTLRANVELANRTLGARAILVTAPEDDGAKSATLANLAIAFARAGKRVVLVDLNLRRPTLHRFFGAAGQPGVSDLVLGEADLDDVLVPVPVSSQGDSVQASDNGRSRQDGVLQLVPAGPALAEAGQFIGSEAVLELLAELRRRSDLVLIDAPPLLKVSDALTVSAGADAILLVVPLDEVRQQTVNETGRVLASAPVDVLGLVVTGAPLESGYGYERTQRRPEVRAGGAKERVS